MPRNFAVAELTDAQFTWLIDRILDGDTNREICTAFERKFKSPLARTSLQRWREATGDELAERYRLARYQARKLQEALGAEDREKYAVVIESIEDRLLAATREISKLDPFKLILVKQEEERRKLQERTLALKERQQAFTEEQARRKAELEQNRFGIAASAWEFLLTWAHQNNPQAADILTALSGNFLPALEEHLAQT